MEVHVYKSRRTAVALIPPSPSPPPPPSFSSSFRDHCPCSFFQSQPKTSQHFPFWLDTSCIWNRYVFPPPSLFRLLQKICDKPSKKEKTKKRKSFLKTLVDDDGFLKSQCTRFFSVFSFFFRLYSEHAWMNCGPSGPKDTFLRRSFLRRLRRRHCSHIKREKRPAETHA